MAEESGGRGETGHKDSSASSEISTLIRHLLRKMPPSSKGRLYKTPPQMLRSTFIPCSQRLFVFIAVMVRQAHHERR